MTDISRRTLLKSAVATCAAYAVSCEATMTTPPTIDPEVAEDLHDAAIE